MIFKTFSSNGGFLSSFGVFGRSFSQITQSVSNDIQRWKTDAQYSQEALDALTESNGGKYVEGSRQAALSQMPADLSPSKFSHGFLRSGYLRNPFGSEAINSSAIEQYKQFQQKLESGAETAKAFCQSTDNLDASILRYANSCGYTNMSLEGFKQSLDKSTLSVRAAELGMKALAIASNFVLMAGISALISGFIQFLQVSDKVANKAKECGESFKQEADSIEQYKQKIAELQQTANSQTASVEEVTTARKNLLSVQDEMIEKFGSEKETIDIVTEAINGQADALDKLTSKTWQEKLNDFNTEAGKIGNLKYAFGFGGYHSRVEEMLGEYENVQSIIGASDLFSGLDVDDATYQKFLQLAKSLGAEVISDDMGYDLLQINGNASQVYETLSAIQTEAKNLQLPDSISERIGDYVKKAQNLKDTWQQFYEEYILQEEILSKSGQENGYDDYYKNLVNVKSKIDEAFKSGNDEARQDAIEEYGNILSEATNNIDDEDIVNFFHNMYPTIQEEVDTWNFKVKFEANTDGLKDSIAGYVQQFKDAGYSSDEIANYDPTNSNDVALNTAYYGLKGSLNDNNIDIQKTTGLLEELRLAKSRTQIELEKKFKVDLSGADEATQFILDNLETAAKVTDRSVDSVESLYKATKKLATVDTSKTLSKTEIISQINGISEGFEELDKIMSSIIDNDKAFDFSLLDDKNFTEIFSGYTDEYNKFIETITNSPKDIKSCQSAFDDLATAYIYAQPFMQQLSDSTADVTAQYLKLMGVSNSAEVVAAALAQQHAEVAWKTRDLSNATAEEIQELANESETTDTARLAYKAYIAQKLLDQVLNTNGDIAALAKIISALGLASDAWKHYYAAKQQQEALASASIQKHADGSTYKTIDYDRETGNVLTKKNGKYYTNDGKEYTGLVASKIVSSYAEQQISDQTDKYYEKLAKDFEEKAKVPINGYSGGNKSSNTSASNDKGGSGSNSGSDSEKDFDWIERRKKLLEEEISELDSKANSSRLRYVGIDDDTTTRALSLFDKIHNQATLSMDDFAWLTQAASSAGMSLDEFYQHVQNGGGVSRASYLEEEIAKIKAQIPEYQQIAEQYSKQYEEAVSKLPEEYRKKIEAGGDKVEKLKKDDGSEEVQDAIDLYDKYKEALQDVETQEDDLYTKQKQKYDDTNEYLEHQQQLLEDRNSLISKQIDYLDATGSLVSASAYESLIANLDQQKALVEQQLENRKRELAAMMAENPDYEGSADYYELQQSIDDAELSLLDLSTQQAEYNDTLLQLPINNIQKLVDMYDDITTAMENWKNEIESAGKSVTGDYYQEQIKNGQATIHQLQEQRSAVEDVIQEYETGSDKWVEMNSKLNDIDSSISSIVVNMNEWNEAMLQIPIDKMEQLVSDLQLVKDALDDVNEEHQTVISAVTGAIDKQREAWEDAQEAETDAIQDRIDAIQDQLDLLDEQNEALDLQVAKEQALKKLEDAKTQKKNRVIRDGQVVYEADEDAIRDATESLQDAEANIKKNQLEKEKEALEDQLDDINDKYDDLYDKLDKIANKWEKIQSDREQASNEKVADRYLGDDWINKVLSGNDDDIYDAFKELYNQNVDSQEQYDSQIKSTEQIQTLVNTYISAYRSGTLTRDQAMSGIRNVLASVNQEMTAGDNVRNILAYLSTQNSTGATTNDILAATQSQLSNTANDIMASLDVYESNSNMITKYMSTFPQLQDTVSSMLNTIDDVDDSLDDINDTLSDGFDDVVETLGSWRKQQEEEDDDDDDGDTSTKHDTYDAPNGWQSSDKFDGGNGKQGYEAGWTRKYADGIKEGIIGNVGDKEKYMAIREMATTNLKPDEQPILAHSGEIVLNPDQQKQLLKNIQQSAITPDMLLKPVNVPMLSNSSDQNITMNFGDLSFPDVRDVDGFAKAVARDFPGLMRQAMSKTR